MPFGKKVSIFEQRVNWLVNNKDVWYAWFQNHIDGIEFYLGRKNFWQFLIKKMQKAELFSNKTYPLDIKLHNEMIAATKILRGRS